MITTYKEYLKICTGIDEMKEKKNCDFCGKSLLKNPSNIQWKFYNKKRFNNNLIFWKSANNDFILHPECAMNLSIELIKDAKISKFGDCVVTIMNNKFPSQKK